MTETPVGDRSTLGGPWKVALDSLDSAEVRRGIDVETIAAPEGLAPFAVAFAADIHSPRHGVDDAYGSGRFIILHDPAGPDAWEGVFRIVCYVQAPLEREIGTDPVFADVVWSWLMDCLTARGAGFHAQSGTATTVLSTGFGSLADQGSGAQIEVRASWTPESADVRSHLESWGDFVGMVAGLPPEGVSSLDERRSAGDR